MPYRRSFVRRSFTRRRPRWMWIRDDKKFLTFSVPGYVDLMSDWRAKFGISINLPELTLWRFRLKLSIIGTISVAGAPSAADGVFVSSYVDSLSQAQAITANTDFYSQHFLIFDHQYSSQSFVGQGTNLAITTTTSQVIYKEYDVKAHRKFTKLDDTLILELETMGDFVISQMSYTLLALYRAPGR